jgi:hypothetical protein
MYVMVIPCRGQLVGLIIAVPEITTESDLFTILAQHDIARVAYSFETAHWAREFTVYLSSGETLGQLPDYTDGSIGDAIIEAVDKFAIIFI